MQGAPSSGSPWESQANIRDETVWGCTEDKTGPVGTGHAGSVFGETFIEPQWGKWAKVTCAGCH